MYVCTSSVVHEATAVLTYNAVSSGIADELLFGSMAVSTELVQIPFECMAPFPRKASIPFYTPLCSVRIGT